MLEKDNSQLELFQKTNSDFETISGTPRPFLSHIRGHEKVILLAICFIVASVISFSFGVERGKSLVFLKSESRMDMASVVQNSAATQQMAKPQPVQTAQQVQVKRQDLAIKPPVNTTGVYTIQIATYRNKSSAQKEAEILRKKGLSALVFSKGAYSILCVGNFNNKDAAKPTLVELKKRYKDCFIRRL